MDNSLQEVISAEVSFSVYGSFNLSDQK